MSWDSINLTPSQSVLANRTLSMQAAVTQKHETTEGSRITVLGHSAKHETAYLSRIGGWSLAGASLSNTLCHYCHPAIYCR